jgi:multidrug efflux pump
VRSSKTNSLVPLSNMVHVDEIAGPTELKRFNRLRSITISANLVPGYSLGEALDYMQKLIRTELPPMRRSTTTASRASSSAPAGACT